MLLLVVGAVLLGPVGFNYVSEFLAVDSCLDSGGSFDYSRSTCDREQNHPFVAYAYRHPAAGRLAAAGALFAVAGMVVLSFRWVQRNRAV